jgi:hypothetical protein
MRAGRAAPIADAGGVAILPGVRVSFQRFALPESGVVDTVPRSLGALPVGIADNGTILVPVEDREAIWLGFSTVRPGMRAEVTVSATLADGMAWQAHAGPAGAARPILVAPTAQLAGMSRSDGRFGVFARAATPASPGCRALTFRVRVLRDGRARSARAATVTVKLVDGREFARATGAPPPPPLDPAAAYAGWRMP